MLERPKTMGVQPLLDLGQSLLAFAGGAERPSVHTKGNRLPFGYALLLADPQSPSDVVGGRRWLEAKDVNEANEEQRLGEGKRMPERVGAFYCCPQLVDGSIRVAEHPRHERQEELALHAGVWTRPIRELHVRIEHLEAPTKVRKRRLEFPLVERRRAARHVPPDETGRIVTPFGDMQRLLGKMLRLLHLE
jgi:hypothetical protein